MALTGSTLARHPERCGCRRVAPAGLLLLACLPAAAWADSLADAFGRDSRTTLHLRSYYFDRLNPGDVTNAAWAIGGWVGYESGWIGDVLQLGLVGYTSQRLWGPLDKTGSGLLAPPQGGYSALGEAYASLKAWDQVLTGGRFQVDQPEINATDNRMTPITYSGCKLAGWASAVRRGRWPTSRLAAAMRTRRRTRAGPATPT